MEYRKNMRTPLDRVDDAFLRQMLEENAQEIRFGEACTQRCHRPFSTEQTGCGCRKDRRGEEHEPEVRSGCSIGICGRNRRADEHDHEFRSGCGCRRESRPDEHEHDNTSGCGCRNGRTNAVREGHPLAMVYSPSQEWREILEEEEAMVHGTLFRELIFPWYPTACRGDNNCGCQGGQR